MGIPVYLQFLNYMRVKSVQEAVLLQVFSEFGGRRRSNGSVALNCNDWIRCRQYRENNIFMLGCEPMARESFVSDMKLHGLNNTSFNRESLVIPIRDYCKCNAARSHLY